MAEIELKPPPDHRAAFARVRDMVDLLTFWLTLERKSLKRLTDPDDRQGLRGAIRETELTLARVSAFITHPGEDEAAAAGAQVYMAHTLWSMLSNRFRSRRLTRRSRVWLQALTTFAGVLEDASPYSQNYDRYDAWWDDLTE